MNNLVTILASCTLGLFCSGADHTAAPAKDTAPESALQKMALIETQAGSPMERDLLQPFDGTSLAGNYLSSTFAQRRQDWQGAYEFLQTVLAQDPENILLLKRAMILAMGAGDFDNARALAEHVNANEEASTLALLFLTADSFQRSDYAQAKDYIARMKESSVSTFMLPLLESWADAAQGVYNIKNLSQNTMHLYHAILIADYLGRYDDIEGLLTSAMNVKGLSSQDEVRIADIYAHIGKSQQAINIYERAIKIDGSQENILRPKIIALENGEKAPLFDRIESPAQGLSEAFYDMARMLYEDFNDDSARIFAYLALRLKPGFDNVELLLGHLGARNDRPDEAIAHYLAVNPQSPLYTRAQRRAADLLEENKRNDEAIALLSALAHEYDDLGALIQIGDVHRRAGEFEKALATYNEAEAKLNGKIDSEYWYLHYVRGVALERLGRWNEAEKELKTALEFQPDHPLVLNYLGYAWADQGVNLKQAQDMIRKASLIDPDDGYIADSLGWVLYKAGKHEEAIPELEKAAELLPYDAVINDHLGDAYWRVGRKLEAHFQWQRARNNIDNDTEDSTQLEAQLDQKLSSGLNDFKVIKEAHSAANGSGQPTHSE